MELYEPARHEPLADTPWSDDAARSAITELMGAVMAAARPDGRWSEHPLDHLSERTRDGALDLYSGALGALWAVHHLASKGLLEAPAHLPGRFGRLAATFGEGPADIDAPGYFLGWAGVLAAARVVTGEPKLDGHLERVLRDNIGNPTLEPLWGSPGSMEAAAMVHAATGDPKWLDVHRDSAAALVGALEDHEGSPFWVQDLYGSQRRLLGAGHGLAGNVHALLWGDVDPRVLAGLGTTLVRTALRHDGLANWPPAPGSDRLLVQWCHGAPGVITSLARYPTGLVPELDALLVEAGELVWRAGPLVKGAGLCHGTAGNGFAFLVLHQRTGEARWLERARRFAMHAIGQARAMAEAHGQPRASLWTGDPGVACYLAACLDGDPAWPTLDRL